MLRCTLIPFIYWLAEVILKHTLLAHIVGTVVMLLVVEKLTAMNILLNGVAIVFVLEIDDILVCSRPAPPTTVAAHPGPRLLEEAHVRRQRARIAGLRTGDECA